ncbi:MAG TPA: DUF3488 and transglutaminase-like domain-containing protein [Bryobacteraceae bacterium]|nr:DUF3488 and transglutaminase-like domain-containing protein [Bryobacteraceae bacterium]
MSPVPRWNAVEPFFEFSLVGLLASGYLAVAGSGYLDGPTALLTAMGLLARALIVIGRIKVEVSTRTINILTVAYVLFYVLDYLYLAREFLTATVHLVFFLAVVKIITARTDRDYFYVKIIAFLELLAASILSSDANYFVFLALFLLFGVATFAASEIRRSAIRSDTIVRIGQKRLNLRLTGLTVFTVLGILVLTASLFFLLPRTARAAFQRFIPQRYHLPGFSNEVTLGQIGELKMRNTAVMHARLANTARPAAFKWRGAALMEFDGRRWSNSVNRNEVLRVDSGILRLASHEDTLRPGNRVAYEIAMQETTSDAIFVAGVPESIQIDVPLVIRTPSNSYRTGFGSPDRLRYHVYAVLETDGDPRYKGEPLSGGLREINLKLPDLDPRIQALAHDLTKTLVPDVERTRLIESYLRRTYPYTTELSQEEVADPVADFLFSRKKGHCEYFASAMAVMLRSVGIPARVATGFQSGIFNPLSGWYLIRASDAHSWVEAWIEGKGWTTFDPTPPDPNPPASSLYTRVQLYFDALQVFWQDWVLSYDLERQLTLAARMEQSGRSFQLRWLEGSMNRLMSRARENFDLAKEHAWKGVATVVTLVLLVMFGPALFRRWRSVLRVRRVQRGEAFASDATLLYQRMLVSLRRRGIEKPLWLTPAEFARIVPDPHTSALLQDFTAAYNDLRYGNRPEVAPKLVNLLDRLERGVFRARAL